jgi:predicted Kef-type K+ transport protein
MRRFVWSRNPMNQEALLPGGCCAKWKEKQLMERMSRTIVLKFSLPRNHFFLSIGIKPANPLLLSEEVLQNLARMRVTWSSVLAVFTVCLAFNCQYVCELVISLPISLAFFFDTEEISLDPWFTSLSWKGLVLQDAGNFVRLKSSNLSFILSGQGM